MADYHCSLLRFTVPREPMQVELFKLSISFFGTQFSGGGGGPATELTNTVCTQGPGVHFRARVHGLDLVLGHRDRARILA